MTTKIKTLLDYTRDKTNFNSIEKYIDYLARYIDYVAGGNVQADIVSAKEPKYHFLQYKADATHNVTRPFNSELFVGKDIFDCQRDDFLRLLKDISIAKEDDELRRTINRMVYSCQQAIGMTLDALPSAENNKAKKLNGDLFEVFIRLLIAEIGVTVKEMTEKVTVRANDQYSFDMNYQHDVMLYKGEELRAIGSVKTSSKDRGDKVFVDKFLYNKLTDLDIPHFAIYLNDVQRAGKAPKFHVNSTFLTAHFMGYTVKLNPLDGVYYCDITHLMQQNDILLKEIHTLDKLFVDDIWKFVGEEPVHSRTRYDD